MLKVHNMDRQAHEFDLKVEGEYDFMIKRYRAVPIEKNEIYSFPVRIAVDKSELLSVKSPLTFTITARSDGKISAKEKSVFIGPESN
jgi:hypothetical protein